MSVHASVFGFFSVLDGVRAIEGGVKKGQLQLTYVDGQAQTVLNNFGVEMLHDIYNEVK